MSLAEPATFNIIYMISNQLLFIINVQLLLLLFEALLSPQQI